jgi:hypothetical protein
MAKRVGTVKIGIRYRTVKRFENPKTLWELKKGGS